MYPHPGASLGASAAVSGLLACALVLYRPSAAAFGQALWVRVMLWAILLCALGASFLPGISLVGHIGRLGLGTLLGFFVPVRAVEAASSSDVERRYLTMYEFVGVFSLSADVASAIKSRWPKVEVASIKDPFSGVGIRFSERLPSDEEEEQVLGSFRESIREISAEYPQDVLVYVEAKCWGGDCAYRGSVFKEGRVACEQQGQGALRKLITFLGVTLDEKEYSSPFEQVFPWQTIA